MSLRNSIYGIGAVARLATPCGKRESENGFCISSNSDRFSLASFNQLESSNSEQNESGLSPHSQPHIHLSKFTKFDDLILKTLSICLPLKTICHYQKQQFPKYFYRARSIKNISIKSINFSSIQIKLYDHYQVYIS